MITNEKTKTQKPNGNSKKARKGKQVIRNVIESNKIGITSEKDCDNMNQQIGMQNSFSIHNF